MLQATNILFLLIATEKKNTLILLAKDFKLYPIGGASFSYFVIFIFFEGRKDYLKQ